VSRTAWRFALAFLAFSGGGASHGADEDWFALQARAEQARQRARQEAISLYAAILDGKLEKRGPCEILNEWNDARIGEDDAKQYFGVEAHATLGPPEHGTKPSEVIDPKSAFRPIFCDGEETEADWKRRFAAFKNDFERYKSKRLGIAQWSYSFPVFSKDYTRAELGVVVQGRNWWDPTVLGGWEGSADFYIYEKRNGAWELAGTGTSGGGAWTGSAMPIE
jgi:hypothetical protein